MNINGKEHDSRQAGRHGAEAVAESLCLILRHREREPTEMALTFELKTHI